MTIPIITVNPHPDAESSILVGNTLKEIFLIQPALTEYSDSGCIATDHEDGNISNNIHVGGQIVNLTSVGVYTMTYDVTDNDQNDAITKYREITVIDNNQNTNPNPNKSNIYGDPFIIPLFQ